MDSNEDVVVEQTDEQSQTDTQDAERTDWKAKAIELEAKYKADIGSLKRELKDLRKPKTETATEAKPDSKAKGFGYEHLAYLEAKGVNAPEDQAWLESTMKESGLELKDLLNKSWVQAELKERKDQRMADSATPTGNKRAGQAARDQVEYWLSKGELPPEDQVDLRRQVVNAKIKQAQQTSTGQFGTAPNLLIK